MPKKKLSKAEKKAKKLQDATDNLAIVLDRAQLAVNNAAPEDDVSVLKAVIDKKRAAFAKLGQRPSEEAMARLCPNCKAAQPKDEPPTCAACEAKTKEKHKYDPARIETKEIRAFMAALPPPPPPGAAEPEAYDWSYVPTDETYEWTYAAVPPKKKKLSKKEKKAKKAQDAIDNLARRLDAARARAAIQDVLKVDLQKERLAKLEELAAQEAEADQRHKDRQRAKAARVDTHQSECSSLERAVSQLSEERSQLEIEVGDVDLRQDINERLREEVGTVRRELDEESVKREAARAERETKAREARVAVARLGRETFRELDPQYEVEARKRVEADVARAPVRNARLTDRKNERAEQAQKLCDRQKALASDLRRHRVEKTMFSELDQARDKRLEKASKARLNAEAAMEASRARLAEGRDAHAASMKRRDACVSAAGRLRDVGSLIQRTRDSACRRRARALALSAALERCAQERETRDALARATRSEEEIEEAEAAAAAASSSDSDSSSSSSGESYSGSESSSDDEDYRAMWCSKAS
mmetsp:Transcript_23061/g.68920  ORF Transcript_23061/g.68920 Transcript_23061/m.68920 type:complete len:532 (+) Transcript_23061:162-1757(+)